MVGTLAAVPTHGVLPPLSNNAGLYAADPAPALERSRAGRHGFLGLPALQTPSSLSLDLTSHSGSLAYNDTTFPLNFLPDAEILGLLALRKQLYEKFFPSIDALCRTHASS